MPRFESAFSYVLIYVFSINDEAHKGCLKVGMTTVKLTPDTLADAMRTNSKVLNIAAKKRIDSYTNTAGIQYKLEYTELALRDNGKGGLEGFQDYNVHFVLINSGVKLKKFPSRGGREWFETNLPTVVNAIAAVKNHQALLSSGQIVSNHDAIEFRPEQLEAIDKTVKRFKTGKKMLWNAKMRFGKTLSALEVVKRLKYTKTIIITHRPVVKEGWHEDFNKIFDKADGYYFSSKDTDGSTTVLSDCISRSVPFIHFASIQDLRGSSLVGGNFDKNDLIFKTNWDLVIIDEAHEGTLTSLGDEVKKAIVKDDTYGKTRVLELSGTPFNLLDDFEQDEIYTWDYVMEQRAKYNWNIEHALDSNPYESLPKLEIYTYDLGKQIKGFVEMEDNAFNFAEFFRTWTGVMKYDHRQMPEGAEVGSFVHEKDVLSFLDLLCKSDDESNYPFSRDEYRDYFRHTLWMVPGVREARALSKLLRKHDVFGQFEIVNVAGDGDEEEPSSDALQRVKKAIGKDPDKTWTITLSCGKLTTGVSVKPWTAVLMLAGTYSTSASNYLQTIFRVQTPANINGRMKERCYVFDFAPDRTLKMVAEAGKLGIKPGEVQSRKNMGEFLNFCPVIAIDGSEMHEYDVDSMLQQLKKAYASKVVQSGFTDNRLYNDELLKLDDLDIKLFEDLKKEIGKNKANDVDKDIVINNQGLTDEEREQLDDIQKKKRKKEPLSEEEKERLEQLKKAKEERGKAIKILRAISIRIPMLIYGMEGDFDRDITIDNFVDSVDETSWKEFMPSGVDKEKFNKIKKYYDRDIFIAAGKQIRARVRGADELEPTERVQRIAEIFSTFKNPDKETVLTPWRVVNMHMSDTLGGYDFYDEKHQELLDEPLMVFQGDVTAATVCNTQAKILEINSKSGLYPLYVTYSIFRKRCESFAEDDLPADVVAKLWQQTVAENVFVICKTPMAKSITKRTLLGFNDGKVNAHYLEDLVGQFKNQPRDVVNKISQKSYWLKGEHGIMKFDAIVGNPPYQVMDNGANSSAMPIYQYFVINANQMKPSYSSFIIPARWYVGGKGLDDFREYMLNDKHIQILHDCLNPEYIFPNTNIRGGVCYFLRNSSFSNSEVGVRVVTHKDSSIVSDTTRPLNILQNDHDPIFMRYSGAISIINKVLSISSRMVDEIISSLRPFGFRGYFVNDKRFHSAPDGIKQPVVCIGKGRQVGYVERKEIVINAKWIDCWKVFMPRANNIGTELNDDNLNTFLGKPGEICTESFLTLGCDLQMTESQALNLTTYLQTRFARFMHMLAKASQDATSKTFRFVPLVSLDNKWTDEALYSLYHLTSDEINYIESMIKPM